MLSSAQFFSKVKQDVLAWAQEREDIRAVIMPGSQARQTHPADEWSDLDLEIFTTDPEAFRADPQWVKTFGTVWIILGLPMDDAWQWLVVYEGGHKVDFTGIGLPELERLVKEQSLWGSGLRGYQILLDKDGLAAQLPPAHPLQPPPWQPPTAEEFHSSINFYFYGAIAAAKQLRRGNLFQARVADSHQHQQLLVMLEWYAHVTHTQPVDTWHHGDFMREWVEPAIWEALHKVFAHFDADDGWQAIFAGFDLYQQLARTTAAHLAYPYPALLAEQIQSYLTELRANHS